jgi:DNA-binding CsgD family transcriptional regulator
MLAGDIEGAREILSNRVSLESTPASDRIRLRVRLAEVELATGDDQSALALLNLIGEVSVGDLRNDTFVEQRCALGAATHDPAPVLEGLQLAEKFGLLFLQGRARLRLAELDHLPLANLRSAFEIFHQLRAEPWRRRVIVELRRRNQPIPRQRRTGGALLTPTEAQIALLIQDGRSNRDIADALFLSIKTVGTYLSRIYAKTNCSSRLELARALDSGDVEGLVERP